MARTRSWINLWLASAAVASAAACSDSSDATLYGSSVADSVGADLGVGQDGAKSDSAAPADADAGAVDATADTAAEVAQDAQSDSGATDAVADAAKPDVAPVDTTAPDAAADAAAEVADTAVDPCAAKLALFTALQTKALACATPFDCYQPAAADGKCQACQRHYNGKVADTQNLVDMAAMLKGNGCGSGCGSGCANLSTAVGVCSAGQCATKELSCKELDSAAAAALAEGAKCKADSDCAFKVSNTLGCGCPTFVNLTTMGPGKPLFNYMKMLVLAYKAKVCVPETSCACPDPNTAKCVGGVCIAQ